MARAAYPPGWSPRPATRIKVRAAMRATHGQFLTTTELAEFAGVDAVTLKRFMTWAGYTQTPDPDRPTTLVWEIHGLDTDDDAGPGDPPEEHIGPWVNVDDSLVARVTEKTTKVVPLAAVPPLTDAGGGEPPSDSWPIEVPGKLRRWADKMRLGIEIRVWRL